MSKESLPQPQNSDEVDLGHLFNAIGKLFDRFIRFVSSIFKSVFSVAMYGLKAIVVNLKLIAAVVIVAGILGVVLEKMKTKVYSSEMLVRTYFDAKYQLATNINYYNALLDNERHETLSDIFGIHKDTIKSIVSFDIYPGPETENDIIIEYDNFVKSIDSVRAQDISYEDFVENRDIFSGNIYLINVESTKEDIFKSLEKGLDSSFNNQYSEKKKKKRDDIIEIQKQTLLASIKQLDSLQDIYVDVLQEESKSTTASINLSEGFPLTQEKSTTKEYQLLTKEIELRDQLRMLEEQKVEESVYFDVISSFQEIGNEKSNLLNKYSITLPILAFVLLCLGYLTKKFSRYVRNYEG